MPANAVAAAIRRRPLAAFFALAYAGCWAFLLVPALARDGLGLLPFSLPVPVLLFFPPATLAGTALAAFLVARVADGPTVARSLRRAPLAWRVHPGWYALALLGMPAAYFAGALPVLGVAPLAALARDASPLLTSYLPNVIVLYFLISVWEEIGWAGFATPRLQARFGPVAGSAILGTLWALWHLPAFFVAGQVVEEKVGLHNLYLLGVYLPLLVASAIPARMAMTWLYNASGGSVLIVGLFHAAWDMTGSKLAPLYLPEIERRFAYGQWTLALLWGLAAVLLVATRGTLAYRPGRGTGDAPGDTTVGPRRDDPAERRFV
jgi:membrane protease YdiL (CAAX protease family)